MSAPRFVVSSFCHNSGCVAVAALSGGAVAVRDSKAVSGPVLAFTAEEWRTFVAGVKNSEFDFTPVGTGQADSIRST
jgi:hypothetical protein